ncbi:hypothetical protein tb265_44360 [Gemmatimonadetes bacterium T265]|nr:hypothetical protein tb265_44360 [Gemmatimonadetes bacterium T265]
MTATSAVPAAADVQVFPTSFQQQRFWLLDQIDAEAAAYTVPVALHLAGPLDVDALREAFGLLVARHEALRTVFRAGADAPEQVVLPHVAAPLVVEDVTARPAAERERAVAERARANANAPFDLAAGPPVRASLLRLAPDEHVLLAAFHHVVVDGVSLGILFGELHDAYGALAAGRTPAFADLPLQYADYAAWQRRALGTPAAGRRLDAWAERLAGVPPLELPTDRPRPAVQSLAGAKREAHVPAATADALRAMARARGATPYAACLAAFVALLHRYTGQGDFAVGSVTAGRGRAELERVVGLFVNTLALRVMPDADAPFDALLAHVRDVALAALADQEVPFEQVVERMQPARDRGRAPIVQVAFQFLDGLGAEPRLPGLRVTRVAAAKETAKFELTLVVRPAPDGGLVTVAEYNTDLFDAATVDRLLAHYGALLAAAACDPGALVGRLPLLGLAERALVTGRWNATAAPLPTWTVPSRVLAQAAATPSATAVRAGDDTLTYAELARRSAAVARRLRVLGVRAGDRVAVAVDRTTTLPVALLAVLRAGAAYVPLDVGYPAERLAHVLDDAGVRAVVTAERSRERLPAVEAPVLVLDDATWDAAADVEPAADAPMVDADALAYVLYTSGSTGRPKGVMVSHGALANFLASMAERPGLAAADAVVAVTTVAFDIAGLELWLPLVVGAEVVIAPRATAVDGTELGALLARTADRARSERGGRVLLQATPSTWRLLIAAGWTGTNGLTMLCGGEAWPAELAAALRPRGAALWNVYGPTETTIWSARDHVTNDDVALGEPLANTTLYVLEPSGDPAPLGVPGELWIGGAGLARGYHGRPDLTAERFAPHPEFGRLYRTGDRVRRHADGRLEFLGRLDDQVKVRGYRVELGEIEGVVAAAPGVTQTVANLCRRDDAAEPALVAYFVHSTLAAADEPAFVADLRARLRLTLPDYMVPAAVVRLAALPLTPNGKVDRRALPAPAATDVGPASNAAPYVAPRSPLEAQIADAWAAALGVARVGVHDDFFALGGHSLAAMRAVGRLADVAPARVTVGMVFAAPTVAAFVAAVVQRLADDQAAAVADDDATLAAMLAEIDGLSDDDVARLLAEPVAEEPR